MVYGNSFGNKCDIKWETASNHSLLSGKGNNDNTLH